MSSFACFFALSVIPDNASSSDGSVNSGSNSSSRPSFVGTRIVTCECTNGWDSSCEDFDWERECDCDEDCEDEAPSSMSLGGCDDGAKDGSRRSMMLVARPLTGRRSGSRSSSLASSSSIASPPFRGPR